MLTAVGAGCDDGAVFVRQAHDVGYGADGSQLAVLLQHPGPVLPGSEGQGHLQSHPYPGQFLEGIRAVGPAGIHHRRGVR